MILRYIKRQDMFYPEHSFDLEKLYSKLNTQSHLDFRRFMKLYHSAQKNT